MAKLVVVALLLAALCGLSHAVLRCENFDSLVAGTVYSNTTGFVPGRYIALNPIHFDGQKLFGDPKGRYYGAATVVLANNVSSFFTSPSVAGNVMDLRQMSLEFDFRSLSRADQPKYIRFEFYDYGRLQNLRINNGTVYKGSLVSMVATAAPNTYWAPTRRRRFTSNLGEIFVVNNASRIERFWVGGDRLFLDNVCYDTDWHQYPQKLHLSADVRLVASLLSVATAAVMAMLLM